MITGLVILGLFFTVAVLLTRLHEARYQNGLLQRQLERQSRARVTLMALMTPSPYQRRPEQ